MSNTLRSAMSVGKGKAVFENNKTFASSTFHDKSTGFEP